MALAIAVSSCKKDSDVELQNEQKLSMDAELRASLPGNLNQMGANGAPLKVCVDKFTNSRPIILGEDDDDVSGRGVAVRGTKWPNGKTLRVYFINGGQIVRDNVMKFARRWANHANLHFVVTQNKAESDIRVGFKVNGDWGHWSWIGTDANEHKGEQTMNFGDLDRNSSDYDYGYYVLHEFGHAIGLGHEHLSPLANINWDKPAVYQYYMGPPNNWTRAQVNSNIFDKYKPREVRNTAYDTNSIMHYWIPNEFTTDNFSVDENAYLSDKDKIFIKRIYPG
ncbi:M12 family metallopeptidase [Pedobacter frigidisoli]|nr:M12 family metallopeptidase [Pedobacter frigidisoli]